MIARLALASSYVYPAPGLDAARLTRRELPARRSARCQCCELPARRGVSMARLALPSLCPAPVGSVDLHSGCPHVSLLRMVLCTRSVGIAPLLIGCTAP